MRPRVAHKIPSRNIAEYARVLVAVVDRAAHHTAELRGALDHAAASPADQRGWIHQVRSRTRAEVGGPKASAIAVTYAIKLVDWTLGDWSKRVRARGFDPQELLGVNGGTRPRSTALRRDAAPVPTAPRIGATRIRAKLDRLGLDLDDPAMRRQVTRFAKENVRLIDDLARDEATRVAQVVEKGLVNRWSREVMGDKIAEATGMVRRRAKLIAADQMLRLHGKMTEVLCDKAGVRQYVWVTMQDGHVRPEHADREGQVFSWDEPPEDGHPGEAIACRCVAEPIPTDDDEPDDADSDEDTDGPDDGEDDFDPEGEGDSFEPEE